MSEILRKAIADAARVVEERASNVKKIESQIADANSRLKKSEAYRERFALDAQLGKAQAISEIAKASAEQAGALGDLSDLGRALSEAKLRLVEVERELGNAKRGLTNFEIKILQRERFENAVEIDELKRNLVRRCLRDEELGLQIIGMLPRALNGMSDHEAIMGPAKRLREALPAESFGAREARQWNLPEQPDEKDKAA